MHSYEMVKKTPQDPAGVIPKWLVKQALNHTSDSTETFGDPFDRALSCVKSRE